jgi:hypothetical protein
VTSSPLTAHLGVADPECLLDALASALAVYPPSYWRGEVLRPDLAAVFTLTGHRINQAAATRPH